MPIRMSGLISGMDTESIIKELMNAQNTKKTKIENKITKHEWKEEKWKDLNSKISALYTGTLTKARMQGSYLTKKVTSSDETKLTATASTSAVNGTHTVKVKQLANAQYVTSEQMVGKKNAKGEDIIVSGNTKLTDLGFKLDANQETMINIEAGSKSVSVSVTENTTVNDFLSACKDVGLNANYDTAQKRFFLSAADSGIENAFSITTSTATDVQEKNAVREMLNYKNLSSANRSKVDNALLAYKNGTAEEKEAAFDTLSSVFVEEKANALAKEWTEAYEKGASIPTEAKSKMDAAADKAEEDYKKAHTTIDADELNKARNNAAAKAASEYVTELKDAFADGTQAGGAGNPFYDGAIDFKQKLQTYASASSQIITDPDSKLDKDALECLGLTEIRAEAQGDGTIKYTTGNKNIALVEASDSVIEYNGVELTSSSNTIIANGLTMNLIGETAGQTISINVSKDSQAVYDVVKSFIKEYNEVLGEMNDAYNAKSARGYEPLTDEEREAMTEEQIEKWEDKIKGALLRRDSTLGSMLTSMKSAMQTSITYNGKSYALSSFGISMTDYTEYGKLHIYGDEDDASVAGKEDKLMAAIEQDPDMVMNVLTGIAGKLYETLQDKMKSTSLSSSQTVYNDKQMAKELTAYKEELKKMETRLQEIEDRYYKQFTAMETALAKINSQSNSLASLIGGSTQQ